MFPGPGTMHICHKVGKQGTFSREDKAQFLPAQFQHLPVMFPGPGTQRTVAFLSPELGSSSVST